MDDIVLEQKDGPLKGLKLIAELEIGAEGGMNDKDRSSILTDDIDLDDSNDSFEELDFAKGNSNDIEDNRRDNMHSS